MLEPPNVPGHTRSLSKHRAMRGGPESVSVLFAVVRASLSNRSRSRANYSQPHEPWRAIDSVIVKVRAAATRCCARSFPGRHRWPTGAGSRAPLHSASFHFTFASDGVHGPTNHSSAIRRGDIYWIDADEDRGSVPGRPHPHVIVQDDVFNDSRLTSVIVCALSTNAKLFNEPGNVLLDRQEGNLEKQSVVVVSRISRVEKSQLGPRIGALSPARVDAIVAGLRLQQRSFLPRSSPGDA